ncbi:MAG: hypothetical protein A2133_04390 [Actinobacteria bacterium RBG_16_64_13]|nr:MAG: hypothetical protein A2133_04390 [Actinobacteria bacterium RBG_16_64_13]
MGNPIVHFELMVTDPAKAKGFYTKVFDWTIEESSMPGYSMITTGTPPAGGMMAKPEMAPMSALNTYFGVDDVDATLAKAVAAGATTIAPKMEIPGMGYWAMFTDPDGIPIGIFQGQ